MKKYNTNFSESELLKAIHSNDDESAAILQDPDKWSSFKKKLDEFIHKAYKIPVMGGLVDDIVSMIQLVDAYVKKEYRDIPWTSMLSIVGALAYVLSPIDIIPDAIPVLGYLDDAAVVLLVLKLGAGHDLEKFKKYQESERETVICRLIKTMGKVINDILGDALLGAIIIDNEEKFRVLAVEKSEIEEPYSATVHYLNIPVDVLEKMFIEGKDDILAFFNRVATENEFYWSPIGKLEAIHEADFRLYEDYFSLTEGEEAYE